MSGSPTFDREKNKQDACTGVHSAYRREENRYNLDICVLRHSTTPSTAHAEADAGISWS